ncbi:Rnf25 [Symbiodinium sp. CCMP2592]|nr:Rnf25 [Symbiodinium sp. CCMP2592]
MHSSSVLDDALQEEVELLRAMWPEESDLSILHFPDGDPAEIHARISVHLVPHTAGEDHARFVRVQLVLDVPHGYPHKPVQLALGASRGLPDSRSEGLVSQLRAASDELRGQPALYALLQAAQDILTELNVPSGDCAICLVDFNMDEDDPAQRTPCSHLLPSCLSSYWWTEWEKQLEPLSLRARATSCVSKAEVFCPECRSPLHWPELSALHSSLLCRDAERLRTAAAAAAAEKPEEKTEDEELEVLLPQEEAQPMMQLPSSEQVLLFEVVHPKGTCFRSRPRWSAKVANGQVSRGVHGVVAELVEGDTTYLRPEGSKHLLPVKGLSANIKLVHLEPRRKEATDAPLS